MSELKIALAEEIGDSRFFIGREKEIAFYLDWVEKAKMLHSKSRALLARRKMGKTALVQRLFNIIFHKNDSQIVPFFFRVPERPLRTAAFGLEFYRAFLTQYFAFQKRMPELVNRSLSLTKLKELAKADDLILEDIEAIEEFLAKTPESVWSHAQSAPHRLAVARDIRIIQFIDEFQYLNRFIFDDERPDTQVDLCHSYMGLAESKYAPLLVTGSYIGWLTTILNHMTARFEDRQLGPLEDQDALAAVYNYAALTGVEVNDATAAYIAEITFNDPFYISQVIRTSKDELDLMTEEGVRDALQYETTYGKGYIASVWMEYIAEGVARINDVNGKKIVLYLAKHGEKEITRDQIASDLALDLNEQELADRLYQLKQADLIAAGSSDYRFKGLGDPIFEVVFRKRYAEEIERVLPQEIAANFEEQMKQARRRTAWFKGLAGEYRVMYYLLLAICKGVEPTEILFCPCEGFRLSGLTDLKKRTIHFDQSHSEEIDIFARAEGESGIDLIVEVKTWTRPVGADVVAAFAEQKKQLSKRLNRPTAFLLYSEKGFSPQAEELLKENGVMYSDYAKLTSFMSTV